MLYGLTEQQVALLQQVINALREGGFNFTPVGMSAAPGQQSAARRPRPFPRPIWFKITGALGVETYSAKSYDGVYDFTAFDGTAGYAEELLGTLATDNDCIVINVNGDTGVSDNILTEGGGPSHPFQGWVSAYTETGMKIIIIDGYDPETCT